MPAGLLEGGLPAPRVRPSIRSRCISAAGRPKHDRMKIKILSFHRENNYGATLQAYALRQYLLSLGHKVDFIDFPRSAESSYLGRVLKRWVGRNPTATARKWKAELSACLYSYTSGGVTKAFQDEFLPDGPRHYKTLRQLQSHPPEADCYIVGSDQVWSDKLVSEAAFLAYFLDFGPGSIRRIAYAASSGGESFPTGLHQPIGRCLRSFHLIGVREESLRDTLGLLDVTNCEWTPDPTVLIDWSVHLGRDGPCKPSGIGLFLLNRAHYSKVSIDDLSFFARNKSYDERIVDLSRRWYNPIEWVKTIASRQLLITDSYHAVLFAIYTQTPFVFIRWGANHKRDERVLFLLKQLGLCDLACNTIAPGDPLLAAAAEVDWQSVSLRIAAMRSVGVAFLRRALA
jgi:hypothetical protein